MSEHDDALDHDELAPEPFMLGMLSAYRDEEDMPSDAKARVQRRLESAPVVAAGDSAAAGSRGLWIGAAAVAAVVVALLVAPRLGADGNEEPESSAEYQSTEPPPNQEAMEPVVERDTAPVPAPESESAAGVGPEQPEVEASDAEEEKPAVRKRGEGTTKARNKPATDATESESAPAEALSPADSLAEETALLRRAQAALSSNEPRSALSILREHERRFPDGVLAEERRALKVVALCDDGQVERGRKQAKAFAAKHPGSALRERVAAACPEASK